MQAVNQLFIAFMKNRVIYNDRYIKPFYPVNQEVFLHNAKILCTSISIYVNNCYSPPVDFFIGHLKWSTTIEISALGMATLLN